jgi:beta-lactamase class A
MSGAKPDPPKLPPLLMTPNYRPRRRFLRSWRIWAIAGVIVVAVTAGVIDVSLAAKHHKRPSPSSVATASRAHRGRAEANPLDSRAMRSLLAHRADRVGIAVENLRTKKFFWYHPGRREQTASIVKVDILETLLRQAMVANKPLDEETAETAQGMIENSDNDDATDLWNQVGAASGISAYNAQAGLKDTSPNTQGYWGETLTTAPDQIALLKQLVIRHSLLNRASQSYQLGLMSNVEADQRWGVSGGVPSSAQIALKNGWLPLTGDDWQINSIGRIKGDGRWYLIAVLTTGNPTEGYGIDTIESISALVWKALTPRPSS